MEPIVLRRARGRLLVLLACSLLFVAGGVYILAQGGSRGAGWAAVGFFGGGVLVFARWLLDPSPALVIADAGITAKRFKVGTIEWADIRRVSVPIVHGTPFLCLDVRDPDKYLRRLSPLMRHAAGLNRRLGFGDLTLSLSDVAVDPAELQRLVAARGTAGSSAGG